MSYVSIVITSIDQSQFEGRSCELGIGEVVGSYPSSIYLYLYLELLRFSGTIDKVNIGLF